MKTYALDELDNAALAEVAVIDHEAKQPSGAYTEKTEAAPILSILASIVAAIPR